MFPPTMFEKQLVRSENQKSDNRDNSSEDQMRAENGRALVPVVMSYSFHGSLQIRSESSILINKCHVMDDAGDPHSSFFNR
jgi:hypothetical protein